MAFCGLTIFDLAQALIGDELLFLQIANERNERIESISELTSDAQDLLDD